MQICQRTYLVFTTRKEIWVSGRDSQATDGRDVAGQRQLERARGKVPNLDDSVACAGREPGVAGLDGDAADPTQVAGNDANKFPLGVIGRFDGPRGLVKGERFGKFSRGGKRGRLGFRRIVDRGDHACSVGRCWMGELVVALGGKRRRTTGGEKFLRGWGLIGAGWSDCTLLCE